MAITEYQDNTMVNKHLQHFALGTKFLYVKDRNLYGWSEMLDLAALGLSTITNVLTFSFKWKN